MTAIARWVAAAAVASAAWGQTPEQLLRSERAADRAWGAYQAGRAHDAQSRALLLEALHVTEAKRSSAVDSEDYFAAQALFDALILTGDPVPEEAVLPFADKWRDEVLLLLARGGASEAALLDMREERQTLAQWVAVNNLLYGMRSARFFAKTLAELEIGPTFEVRDTDEVFSHCGGAFGIGLRERSLPPGFPPLVLYRLEVPFMGPLRQGDSVAMAGATDVYVRRVALTSESPAQWEDAALEKIPGTYRERYLAAAAGVSNQRIYELLHPLVRIYWEGAESVAREMARHMDEQETAVRNFVAGVGLPAGSTEGVRVKQAPEVRDVRRTKGEAVPAVAARAIALEQ